MKNVAHKGWVLPFLCMVSMVAAMNSGTLRSMHVAQSFVRNLEFKYILRVCNAYPFRSALDAYVQNGAVKLNTQPMVYKTCADFTPHLFAGERVELRVGDVNAGTFTIQDLPQNDAVLLMIVYRHDIYTDAVAFESHVFSNVATAQIAVLDVHKGRGKSELRIQSAQEGQGVLNIPHSELLRFDSVVAIEPGPYDLVLRGLKDNSTKHQSEFVALPREAYVAIRCGVDAEDGLDYPEELIIFPKSDKAALGAGVHTRPSGFGMMAILVSILSSFTFPQLA